VFFEIPDDDVWWYAHGVVRRLAFTCNFSAQNVIGTKVRLLLLENAALYGPNAPGVWPIAEYRIERLPNMIESPEPPLFLMGVVSNG